jgi:hypothetical protein
VSPLRRSSPWQAWVVRRVSSRVPSVSRVVLSLIIAKIYAFVAVAFIAGISFSIVYVTMIVRRSSVPTGYRREHLCLHHGMWHLSCGLLERTETTSMGVGRSDDDGVHSSNIGSILESILAQTLRELHIQVVSNIEACIWFGFSVR